MQDLHSTPTSRSAQRDSPLFRLPDELLYDIAKRLLCDWDPRDREGSLPQVNLCPVRLVCRYLAALLRPLAWWHFHFAWDDYVTASSLEALQQDVTLRPYVRSADFYFPDALLGFGILNLRSLVNLTSLHITAVGEDNFPTYVPPSITDTLSLLPHLSYLALLNFNGIASETFSFKDHTPALRHLEYEFYNDGTFLCGPELLETITTNTNEQIINVLPTLRNLNLKRSLNGLEKLTAKLQEASGSAPTYPLHRLRLELSLHHKKLAPAFLQALGTTTKLNTLELHLSWLDFPYAEALAECRLFSLKKLMLRCDSEKQKWLGTPDPNPPFGEPHLSAYPLLKQLLYSFPEILTLNLYGFWTDQAKSIKMLPEVRTFADDLLAGSKVEELVLVEEQWGNSCTNVLRVNQTRDGWTEELFWPI